MAIPFLKDRNVLTLSLIQFVLLMIPCHVGTQLFVSLIAISAVIIIYLWQYNYSVKEMFVLCVVTETNQGTTQMALTQT